MWTLQPSPWLKAGQGWAVAVTYVVARTGPRRLSILTDIHALDMVAVAIVTANHWWLDGLAVIALLVLLSRSSRSRCPPVRRCSAYHPRSTSEMPGLDDLRPGDPEKIADYRVLRRLGAGGQGVVYLAVGPSGERVAIKQLRTGPEDHEAKKLLTKEVAAARLVAPFCTAKVLAAQLEGPSPYVVSEYIEGPSLEQYVERHGPMKGVELERLAIGTATALAAIHQAGVVHRDFKPANVMLAEAGPRVIDFGIARDLTTETTLTSKVFGTPAYMAPEQLQAERVGPGADLFAWGSVIAYAATGRAPFQAPHMMAAALRITNEQPDLTGVPTDLLEILRQTLSKDPAHRPTAQQTLALLLGRPVPEQDMADATQVLAEAAGLVQAGLPTRRSKRGLGLAAAAVGLVIVLVVWGSGGLSSKNQDSDSAGAPAISAAGPRSADPQTPRATAPSPARTSAPATPAAKAARAKVATAVTADDSSKPSVPAIFAGHWKGTVFQVFGSPNLWTAELSLDAGDTTGTFRMDELDCSGRATVTSADDSTLVLQVAIKDDPDDACTSRGTVHLVLISRNRGTISWQDDNDTSQLANGFAKRT